MNIKNVLVVGHGKLPGVSRPRRIRLQFRDARDVDEDDDRVDNNIIVGG